MTSEPSIQGRKAVTRFISEINSVTLAGETFNQATLMLMELHKTVLPRMSRDETEEFRAYLVLAKKILDDAGEKILESRRRIYASNGIPISEQEDGFQSADPKGRA